jgi:pantoate--beta-alanine ligase
MEDIEKLEGESVLALANTTTMEDIEKLEGESVLALAVRVSSTRLIDNYVFGDTLSI